MINLDGVGGGGPGGSGQCAGVALPEFGDVKTAQIVGINVDVGLYVDDANVYVIFDEHEAP